MHGRALPIAFVAAFTILAIEERSARAQACCASTSAIFPARLQDAEDALVGVSVKGAIVAGSFDAQHNAQGQPASASETDLGQTLLVTARMLDPLQLNVSVPFVETFRSAGGISDFGGGVGDLGFALRWDITRAGRNRAIPGIAPLVSLTVPSGTAIEMAKDPLGANATGLGSAQVGAGIAVEQIFGRTLVALTGTTTFHGARTVSGVHSQLGPDLAATLGVSYTFQNGFSLGGALTYTGSFDSVIDGASVPDSSRSYAQAAIVAALPLPRDMRMLGALSFVPPISALGQNEPITVSLAVTLVYGFISDRRACYGCANGMCRMHQP